ncbi:hypothetical protein XaC1_102 [Xanthomonas phage XaC1]|nr:hypothetical protein XaC1_102 [Xanthomonas phage XaC1]
MTRQLKNKSNTHIEHLDDTVLYNPDITIKHLNKVQQGTETSTLKWDGAPSIVLGKFDHIAMVGTKSFFSKNETNYVSTEEIIAAGLSSELSYILIVALEYAKDHINEGQLIQGDVMFCTDDKKVQNDKIQFGLNLIKYAVPKELPEYELIKNAKIGIAFHTEYDADYNASPIKELPESSEVLYVFDQYQCTLQDAENQSFHDNSTYCSMLIDYAHKIKQFQGTTLHNLTEYHELYRKYKTMRLRYFDMVCSADHEDFEKFCFGELSEKLFNPEYKYLARQNALQHMLEFNKVLKDTSKYFMLLSAFTFTSQQLVIHNLESTKEHNISAEHEGLVVSTDEYIIKYVDKKNFTKLNNSKRT